ncbi:MAG: hypothetical protein HY074_10335 [Deltaproteobacteria bacterium]|nr:hypothetical protein [Deltaproteobacteria bacterium]
MRQTMKRAGVMAVCFGTAALAVAACKHNITVRGQTMPANYGFFLFSYALNKCPADDYLLPSRGTGAGASFEAGNFGGPYCHDFAKYRLSISNSFDFDARSWVKTWIRWALFGPPIAAILHRALPYASTLQTLESAPIYVRVQSGAPCAVYVAVPTDRMCTGLTLEQCKPYRLARAFTSLLLNLLFKDSELGPREATLNMNGFPEHKDFGQWCSERIRNKFNATSHPIFKIIEPEAGEPNVD